MKIGYARVSTRDQNPALQVDALKAAGCERIYQDVASGAKTARPALDELLGQLRAGDVLVIWKLDRMGRSLKHLVELVGNLMERKVGLLSLNDPIDTTSAQGRFVFNLFATLAEFERELIRERTQAGLTAARARGRVGGRPKGLSPQADATALAAETLYRERKLSVAAIAQKLHLSKSTLYSYLRHRGVEIGPYKNSAQKPPSVPSTQSGNDDPPKVATILVTLRIENNSKFVRGKKRTIEHVENFYLDQYEAKRRPNGEYELKVPYDTDEELDEAVNELLTDIASGADDRHCFSESEARMEGADRHW
ncbi:recombinase family protein (plasmid) [Verminephrobacter aporrectodeae subsp. tuberculatae]|uniref:recombinase family protein n=2 Tax=Verminephrobacter aporrectodeae TaxID=1110389 RepID=UPI000237825D|nr:recombinase family protein [Verminephrobacter aporrectodeae]MCW5223657.1 recombinase family protein [Verminephrobacter aporrectodeae subsp. tuberculatae]MCW5291479.1 recombinase family protein [Verminephrobacter aporrectodeae subsp. tuberculatae]MCW8209499.1 recombinase family protein [Verminephrobacter aporrectodeae subsp. tuberculatae]